MTIPIKNHILDTIRQKENFTDKELEKLLSKEGTIITEGEFNKVLLDLEILYQELVTTGPGLKYVVRRTSESLLYL